MRKGEFRVTGLLLGALLSSAATAGVKEGVDFWQAGNYPKAIAEWRLPAEQGDADAQFNLGQAYKLGRGVALDNKAAQAWYLKAAQKGHQQAQTNLGLMLFQNGDRDAAMPWIRKAADRGEARAQYVLGTALFNGDLAPRDWPRAYALMTRAAASGLPQATTSLQQMDQFLSPTERTGGIAIAQQLQGGTALAATILPPAPPSPAPLTAATIKTTPSRTPATKAAAKPATPARSQTATATPTAPAQPHAAERPGGWRIQLGAYGSAGAAERAWAKIARNASLQGHAPIYTPVQALTRLQAGPFDGKAAAQRACAALTPSGQSCFVIAP